MNKQELHLCDNCRWSGLTPKPIDVGKLGDRLEPGGILPSGECPNCGALCYPVYCDALFVVCEHGTIKEVYGPPWLNFVTIDSLLEDDPELRIHMKARRKLLHRAIESGRIVNLLRAQGGAETEEVTNNYHKDPNQR